MKGSTKFALLVLAILSIIVFLVARAAHADTLASAGQPTDWGVVIALVLIAAGAGGIVVYLRKHPGAAAVAKADTAVALSVADKLAQSLKNLAESHAAVVTAKAPPTIPVVTSADPDPVGKRGQPGIMKFLVGGVDFEADLAAFVAAYNG